MASLCNKFLQQQWFTLWQNVSVLGFTSKKYQNEQRTWSVFNSEMYYLWKCCFWEMKFHNEWRGISKSFHIEWRGISKNHFITSDEAKPSHELWNDFDMPSHELWKDLDLPSHEFWNFISQKPYFHKFHIKNFTTCCIGFKKSYLKLLEKLQNCSHNFHFFKVSDPGSNLRSPFSFVNDLKVEIFIISWFWRQNRWVPMQTLQIFLMKLE